MGNHQIQAENLFASQESHHLDQLQEKQGEYENPQFLGESSLLNTPLKYSTFEGNHNSFHMIHQYKQPSFPSPMKPTKNEQADEQHRYSDYNGPESRLNERQGEYHPSHSPMIGSKNYIHGKYF